MTKVKLRYQHWAFKLPLLRRYQGIVVGRNIWFKLGVADVSKELIRHEMVHQSQMDRHSVIGFYLIYLRDYVINLMKYRNHDKAYWNIPFEKEARGEISRL